MDPNLGKSVCYVQFPQRFDGIDKSDRYANRNTVFFDVSLIFYYRQTSHFSFAFHHNSDFTLYLFIYVCRVVLLDI